MKVFFHNSDQTGYSRKFLRFHNFSNFIYLDLMVGFLVQVIKVKTV